MRKLIGKGAFSRAYLVGENEVEVVSTCPTKECYAMFSQGNPFAPVIERKAPEVFKMPLYPKMRSITRQLNSEALEIYRTLRKFSCKALDYRDFYDMIAQTQLPEEIKAHIQGLAGDVCNAIDCDNMRFEISPRNVSCDDKGNLIMLDCFYCAETLRKTFAW